jgi:pimeloyl-ACP methyl ester carboxylesterase
MTDLALGAAAARPAVVNIFFARCLVLRALGVLPGEPAHKRNLIVSTIATAPIAVTEFDALMPHNSAPISQQTNTAFFSGAGITLVRRLSALLCKASPGAAARIAHKLISTPPRHAPRAWEQQLMQTAERFEVVVGDRRIPAAAWGQGPAVLLVHSWGGRGTQMGRLTAALVAAGYRAVSFDLPAHGESGMGETDMVECAAAVAAVADAATAKFGPLHGVVAHSFGVMATLLAVREHGLITARLVSIGAFEHCRWFMEAAREHLNLTEAVAQRIRDRFEARHGHRVTWDRLSVVELLRQARCATLVIHDRFDREVPYSHSHALRSVGRHIEALPTVGLGHRRTLSDAGVIKASVAYFARTPA